MKHDYYYTHEWTPALKKKADEIIAKIHDVAPELEVLFMGAAALGLPGKNDIDLDILCNAADVKHYAKILKPVLGSPQSLTDDMAVWSYMQGKIEIDCILSDPTMPSSHVSKQKKVFGRLKVNHELCERYRKIKYECDGLPYSQYEAQKQAFFAEVLAI